MNYHQDHALPTSPSIFVFGSNLGGIHGAGAALVAAQQFGAERGVGEGLTGNSYAIPTMTRNFKPLPLELIQKSVQTFVEYAKANPDMKFFVTRVGCGYARYKNEQMATKFKECPKNCDMPESWKQYFARGAKNGRNHSQSDSL